jgi:Fur family transcriptional regulator, ferric uptake regulator
MIVKRPPHRLNKGSHQVLKALGEIGKLSSAQDIHWWFRNHDCEEAPALTTIYRAIDTLLIDTLLRLNLIQSVNVGDGEKRYEAIEPGKHHHHFICTKCLDSVRLDKCFVESVVHKVEQDTHGFTIHSHVLELFGVCARCVKQQDPSDDLSSTAATSRRVTHSQFRHA